MAETLASFSSATAGTPSTAAPWVVGTDRSGAAEKERRAPCWVLKEQPSVVFQRLVRSPKGFGSLPGMAWPRIPPALVGFGVGRDGCLSEPSSGP